MKKIKATEEHKRLIFKQFEDTALGRQFALDMADTIEEFIQMYSAANAIVEDDGTLLILYKTRLINKPDKSLILLSCVIPFDVCFPGYIRPAEIMKFTVKQIFKDITKRHQIITFLPYIPFLGQHFLLSNFRQLKDPIKNITKRKEMPIEGYAFTIHRSELIN